MTRSLYKDHLVRADTLIAAVLQHAPPPGPATDEYRADLAGLLCVTCAAAYENCVKEILVAHARAKNPAFGSFIERLYIKLNSKITRGDLEEYAELFDASYKKKFKGIVDTSEAKLAGRLKTSVKESYANILRWRHAFAHSGQRASTLDEVRRTHAFAKRIIHCFAEGLR
jgi:hypothetical protein